MSGPITWRNVSGPSPTEGLSNMAQAQRTMSGAFDGLQNVLAQYQQGQKIALDRTNEAAKQNFLNDLFAADNVDTLMGQRQAFNERLATLTPEAQAAVRGQFDSRIKDLRDHETAQQQFTDAQNAREWTPTIERLQVMANSGDPELVASAKAALGVYADRGLRGAGKIGGDILAAQRANTQDVRDAERHDLNIRQGNANIQASKSSTAAAAMARELTQRQISKSKQEDQVNALLSKAYLEAQGNTQLQEGLPNPTAMTEAADYLTQGMDATIRARVLQEAKKSDSARVDAWKANEDANGYVGGSSLNPTVVINELAPLFAGIKEGSPTEVGSSISERVRKGYVLKKGTKIGDIELDENVTIPIPLNVAKAALNESDTTFGLDRGGNAASIIDRYMSRPDVQLSIYKRMHAEKLRDASRNNPSLSNTPSRK